MKTADIGTYIVSLFENHILVAISAAGAFLYRFFFPEPQYLCGVAAVLGVMILDLLTKLFALSRSHGGLKRACIDHIINSHSFGKGTFDKLITFGILMIICGLAYRLTIVSAIATWFTQLVFTLMFLRDVLSIIENLIDAGVQGLGPFKKVVSKKFTEICDEPVVTSTTEPSTPVTTTPVATDTNPNIDHI